MMNLSLDWLVIFSRIRLPVGARFNGQKRRARAGAQACPRNIKPGLGYVRVRGCLWTITSRHQEYIRYFFRDVYDPMPRTLPAARAHMAPHNMRGSSQASSRAWKNAWSLRSNAPS